jgi:hypothetical protein
MPTIRRGASAFLPALEPRSNGFALATGSDRFEAAGGRRDLGIFAESPVGEWIRVSLVDIALANLELVIAQALLSYVPFPPASQLP